MLLSPQFMYRVERGTAVAGADHLRLDGYELASRLSYLLWGSMPDDKLFAAAEGGALQTADDVLAQARRMLDDPRAARAAGAVHRPVAAPGGDRRAGEGGHGLHHASGPSCARPCTARRGPCSMR